MSLLTDLLAGVAAGSYPGPFALLHREAADHVDVFTGQLSTAERLADIPLPPDQPGPQTLALVPYRQVTERGFACVDDGAPIECLTITRHERAPLGTLLAALPDVPVAATGGGFDLSDDDYAEIVGDVLRDEIGRGEGANFVIHRSYTAQLTGEPVAAALAALRRLLRDERGAYWTFLVHTGTRTLVGATPERHVSVDDGLATMNPISGTFRHGDTGPDRAALLRFLADPKEIDELYMVLDEELKMMATVADHGGQVVGPYLKEMAHLTHTEYLLAGRGGLDVRAVLRETMFAPTVTGSPMENACRVIARHERRGRGYYAGVLALLGHDEAGRQTLDAPILIRTAEISPSGALRVPVGATLVRHSTAAGEVAETHTKAAGVLTALGLIPAGAGTEVRTNAPPTARPGDNPTARPGDNPTARPGDNPTARPGDDPAVRAALAARNTRLAGFWLHERRPGDSTVPELVDRHALIVDAEDTFTGMLAHQFRALGLSVTVRPWQRPGEIAGFDLVVPGPGPGDPDGDEPKMRDTRRLVADLLERRQPLLAVCLGHQIIARHLGLRLHRRDAPYQGVQRDIDLFGQRRVVGFYSTFTAVADADSVASPYGQVELARDVDATVHALRGPGFAGVQFHPESVLSFDGMTVLRELVCGVLASAAPTPPAPGPTPVVATLP